jgi:hypothetical protein
MCENMDAAVTELWALFVDSREHVLRRKVRA